jgi:hypothetical protein
MNEIVKGLREPFGREAIKQRVGGGNRKFDYLEAHSVINRLNNVLDYWDFSIISLTWQDDVLIAHVEMNVPGVGRRQHIGVQKMDARAGEDTIKGAVSDALKKCATLFGVGIDLYGDDYEHYGEPAPQEFSPPVDPHEVKRIEYANLKAEFGSLCGELLGEDVSTYDDSQVVEFVEGIMGSGYKITTARPSIGDYKKVIAKMKEQRGK